MRTKELEWKRGARGAAALLVLALAACGGDSAAGPTGPGPGQPEGPRPVATVVVSPDTILLQLAHTRMLSATPQAADRTPLTGRAIAWSTSDSAVAVVTREGIVVAQGAGSAVITATSEGKQGHARVEIPPPPPPPAVAHVRITPGEVTMSEDPATWKLTARTWAADGTELTGRAIAWASSDTAVVKVYDGSLLIKASGTAYVTATSEGRSAQAKVTVPEWQRARQLTSAAGSALPAPVETRSYVDAGGVTRTVRRVVTDGAIRFSVVGDRYEQRLTVQTYEDGVLVRTERYSDRGTHISNWLEGTLTFISTQYAGHTFTAGPTYDGGLAVTQRMGGEGAPATYIFGR